VRCCRYVLTADGKFEPAESAVLSTYADAKANAGGLSSDEAGKLLDFFGPNKIPFRPDTILESVAMEFFAWFYLFQLMAYMIWCEASAAASVPLRHFHLVVCVAFSDPKT